MIVWKEFRFEAAHQLTNLPAAHKCSRLHGHSYRFRLFIDGPLDPMLGWVTDFGGLLKAAGDMICEVVDHRYLNEVEGLENPTAEILALWIWERVQCTQFGIPDAVCWLAAVEVQETCTAGVRYEGP